MGSTVSLCKIFAQVSSAAKHLRRVPRVMLVGAWKQFFSGRIDDFEIGDKNRRRETR